MNQTDYFTEKIATLPEDLQEAIQASNHQAVLQDIQREYRLHIDQAQTLETLATQLIFGDIDAPTFVNHMFNEAHVSSSAAGDMLLKIDTLILRKIRLFLEKIDEDRKKEAELQKALMSEEEEEEENTSEAYAEYYANVANILKETKENLLAEGILPDGSNITDEMMAKEMGITVEELHRMKEVGAFEEAQTKPSSYIENHAQIHSEKEELLHELESPRKSFVTPLFTPITQTKKTQMPFVKVEIPSSQVEETVPPDHQLQNTQIETPYKEETVVPQTESTPVIKKPTRVVLSNDPYKEPIE